MRKIIKLCSLVLLILTLSLLTVTSVLADNTAGFWASPILPDNQRADAKGYFDIEVEPGQVQDLSIEVTNSEGEDISVEVEAITASTNVNGVVNYTTPGENHDSIPYQISDLIYIEEDEITIPANESKIITVQVQMPDEQYDGYILGAVHIKKKLTEEELNSGQTILNQFSYVVAVKITETDKVIENDFAVDGVQAELVNGRAAITNRIVNPRPILVKGMETKVKIFPLGMDQPVLEGVMENTDMAPNSVFSFQLLDEVGSGVQAGMYVAAIEITYNEKNWSFEEEFEITSGEAENISDSSIGQETERPEISLWMIAAILLAVILLFSLVKSKFVDKRNK